MRCPNCLSQNPPTAKFCLECGNRLVVCPHCGTINLPRAKFCIECGSPLPSTSTTESENRPLQLAKTGKAQDSADLDGSSKIRLAAPEERRVVTIMFADITGSTPLADKLDPEDLRAILAGYFNLMTEQIRRHGGTVEKYIGDAVMAIFGSPIAHEDDPDRAIRAALDMQEALAKFNQRRQAQDSAANRLQMRIGINTGEVASPGAQFRRHDFLITGDAVNVAARLQQVAMPDMILVGERTYLATRNVFEFRPLAPLMLKGKPEPIRAWVVQDFRHGRDASHPYAIIQHPRGIEGLEAPLVGRDLELTLMHATFARVQAERRSHLITLLGAPGIGKSRLVRDFIAREQEAAKCTSCNEGLSAPRVLQGRCPPYGEGITYWPLVEILRSLLNIEDSESREGLHQRLIEFVQDILVKAKSNEDPTEIASALMRSVGSGPGGDGREPNFTERREIQRSTYSKSTEQGGTHAMLLRAWRIFLEAIAQQEPLILVIDDLQWADEALLDLLEYLTDRIDDVPILFLCPARLDFYERRRDWGGGRRNFTTIVLEVLTNEESRDLVTGLLETQDLPEVLYHTIQNRAEGNPFFIEEIVRMLIDQGMLVNQQGCWVISEQNETIISELASPAMPPEDTLIDQHYVLPLPLPDTVQGVLAARIDLLSQVEKQVLQNAAIIGRTFWLQGIVELVTDIDMDTVLKTLEVLIQREFIIEAQKHSRIPVEYDRVFSFKHVLIRDVVYNAIPRIRRSQKHAHLALWLENTTADNSEAFAELLAYHYQQALATWSATILVNSASVSDLSSPVPGSPTEPIRLTRQELCERAIHFQTIAGDQAYHSYYTIRAIQAYTEALDLLRDSDAPPFTIAKMHMKLGDAYTQRANADEALHEYSHALELMKEAPEIEGNTLLCLYMRMAELSTRWSGWFNTCPDMQEVRVYIDAGLKLLEGRPPNGDHALFLTYQATLYIRQMQDASPIERVELAEKALQSGHEALGIAEEVNDTSSLWVTLDALGFIYYEQHKYADAHRIQHRRQELVSLIKGRDELYDLYSSLGWIHQRTSNFSAAAMWFGRSWRIAQTMESPSMLLRSLIGRMYTWYDWNRWSEVREVAYHILQITEQYQQDPYWLLDALETLADIVYRTGDTEESDSLLRQYRRLAEQRGVQPEPSRSIHLAREDWVRACADFKEALKRNEPFPSPAIVAILAELYVITSEDKESQSAMCERAIAVAEQSGSRKFFAVALRARGRMYLEQLDWTSAERDLQQALHQFEQLDLPWERGQTLYCLGLLYRRRADVINHDDPVEYSADLNRAHFNFEQALGFFESLPAVHDAERARLAFSVDSKAPV
ncbi:MAG TPA: adenylate/guanylate cyclase domain-containing protein [Ktedonobacteraceae bacterium]|nr:adenylate/guanylate cyclase domain-containing protein [Ktedonobacteraceae bacterium]